MLPKFCNLFLQTQNLNRSPLWSSVRKQHLAKQPYCQACGSKTKPEVHHIEPFHVNPSKELDPDNLITLCDKYCHYTIGHLMDYKSWNPNVIEDAKVYLNKVKNRPYLLEASNYDQKNLIVVYICLFFNKLFGWNNGPR